MGVPEDLKAGVIMQAEEVIELTGKRWDERTSLIYHKMSS